MLMQTGKKQSASPPKISMADGKNKEDPKMVMTSGITKYLKHTCYTFSYTHTSA